MEKREAQLRERRSVRICAPSRRIERRASEGGGVRGFVNGKVQLDMGHEVYVTIVGVLVVLTIC